MSTENAKKRKREDGRADEEESGGEGMEKKDEKWEYSAPAIPTSHWIDQGFDDGYIERMEIFLTKIKAFTSALRSGTCDEDIYLGSGANNPNNTFLGHDDALLPHWQEFANALQVYQNTDASLNIAIGKMQLPSSVMKLLTPALKDKPIKAFGLGNNELVDSREGIEFAIEIIQSNEKLEEFGWVDNPIDSMGDANHLVEAIISHPIMDSVHLHNCFGGNVGAYNTLCSLLSSNKSFATIAFESNNIRAGGRTEIPDFLATNPPLEKLQLASNHLDDNDAKLIARALKRNTNLRRLYLGQNDITGIGRDALRHAVFDSTSLNTVAASNHTCFIEGIDFDHINEEEEPKVNRGRKIFSLLSSRNREGVNVHHLDAEFDDDSLKLVPKVLESVSIYAIYGKTDDVYPLSITYEILRSWKMPILYENKKGSHIE